MLIHLVIFCQGLDLHLRFCCLETLTIILLKAFSEIEVGKKPEIIVCVMCVLKDAIKTLDLTKRNLLGVKSHYLTLILSKTPQRCENSTHYKFDIQALRKDFLFNYIPRTKLTDSLLNTSKECI